MVEDQTHAVAKLLSSTDPEEVSVGLEKVWARVRSASVEEKRRYVEMVSALFYIDTLDHPEHMSVVEEAIGVIGSIGEVGIPILIEQLEGGDVKAQMAIGQALGHMGATAIPALLDHYHEICPEASCRAFVLYALGKIKSPYIVDALPTALEAAGDVDQEMRDSATRALGKFAESIPAGSLHADVVASIVERVRANLGDGSPAIRAKAVRTLGKLARYGHLSPDQCQELGVTLHRILGQDERFEWDRAYVVRKEAQEALQYV